MHAEEIAKAWEHIPSGLFVITSTEGELVQGIASWVQQVSFQSTGCKALP